MIRRLLPFLVLVSVAPAWAQDEGSPANPHGNTSLDCASCHAEAPGGTDRAGADFDHATTGFVLEGAHAGAACRDCHDDPVFAHVGIACADCHTDIHRGRLGPDCEGCHRPERWFDRQEQRRRHDGTALPLVGAHVAVDCQACHGDPVTAFYVGTPTDCYACHMETYRSTTTPPHADTGLGTDCLQCHSVYSTGWSGGDFRHPDSFPLTYGHAIADCNACHTDGFTGLPTDCVACHQDDYDRTDDPDHALAGFPTDCLQCHDTRTWEGAVMDHNRTAFPLTGAHRGVDCNSCHANGYTGTPTDCVACHQDDYDGTSEPAHATSGFPTDCMDCHTTSAWEPSTWDHDPLFPINSGKHREAWSSCTECHVLPSDYSVFECILCHEHNDAGESANDHSNVDDYEYLSIRCYECHPRGLKE